MTLTGEFTILLNGELVTYTNYDDIPEFFDNLIMFKPYYPPGPHTQEEHDYIETFDKYLKELLKREQK